MDACEVWLSLLKGGMLHLILVLWTPCCVSETLSIFCCHFAEFERAS